MMPRKIVRFGDNKPTASQVCDSLHELMQKSAVITAHSSGHYEHMTVEFPTSGPECRFGVELMHSELHFVSSHDSAYIRSTMAICADIIAKMWSAKVLPF